MCVGASNELHKESHPGIKRCRVNLRDQFHAPPYSTSELPLFLVCNSVANDVTKLTILIAYYSSGKRYGFETTHARSRENRDRWPLLTVETEANGDSRSTYQRGPSLVGSLGSSYRQKILFSWLSTISLYLYPARQAVYRVACLLICVCGQNLSGGGEVWKTAGRTLDYPL